MAALLTSSARLTAPSPLLPLNTGARVGNNGKYVLGVFLLLLVVLLRRPLLPDQIGLEIALGEKEQEEAEAEEAV